MGGDSSKVFLGGWSRGGAIALSTFLQIGKVPLGGVCCINSTFVTNIDWSTVKSELKNMTPISFLNSSKDEIHSKDEVTASWFLLKQKGINFDCKFIKEQDHSLCNESINNMIEFFASKMTKLPEKDA